MNGGLQKLQVPEFKDKLFYHYYYYYYWEFYSLELFTWTHNIAFNRFKSWMLVWANKVYVLYCCCITKWSFKHSVVSVLTGVLMKSHEYSLRGGKPVCEKSLPVAMVERWGCLKDFLAQMSGWLWVFQWGRPSAKYCGQDDDNPLSLSFIFLSRPFIDDLSWTPIKLHRYISI